MRQAETPSLHDLHTDANVRAMALDDSACDDLDCPYHHPQPISPDDEEAMYQEWLSRQPSAGVAA